MIDVSELTKKYGTFTAVDGVSFQIARGEAFALLGPNGSGKTTILKCIAGLTFADSGSITIGGVDLQKDAKRAKEHLSYLPQRVSFHENLTAREIMEFYSRLRKLPAGRAEWALQRCGLSLDGFIDKPVGKYSGGMVQRLGIALALLPDSPVIILDEPAVNLDPEGTIRFREALHGIAREGKTILFSSHRLSDVAMLADRVAVLVSGRLVAVETVVRLQKELTAGAKLRIVLKNPRQEYADAAARAGASETFLIDSTLTISCDSKLRPAMVRAIEQAGGVIESFSTDDAALEEMYLNYVKKNNGSSGIDASGRLRQGPSFTR